MVDEFINNKKFQCSLVESRGTARKFGGSLMWLYDAGIINFCYNLTLPELPLAGNAKSDVFKVYMRDGKLEIDFFIRKDKTAAAIAVKAADNTKSKAMETVISKYGVRHGIKLSAKNVGGTEKFDSFPLYMAMFL